MNKLICATTIKKVDEIFKKFTPKVINDHITSKDVSVRFCSWYTLVLKEGVDDNKIDIVFDTYRRNCIKNSERSLRGGEASLQLQHITGAHTQSDVGQWSKVNNNTMQSHYLHRAHDTLYSVDMSISI